MANENNNNHNEEEIEEQETEEGVKGTEEGGSSNNNSSGKTDGSENKGRTFTQEQVTKMMTREKNQGRNAAYKELGIDPKDSKMVKMFKAFVDSQKTDDQKAAEKESENQAQLTEANQRALVAEAKVEAMMLGVKPQHVDDIVTLALSKMTEDSDMKTIIGEFKTKYPVWFGESEEDDDKQDNKNKVGQKGTGSSIKTNKEDKKNDEGKGLGARLAAQRKNNAKKSSYWGT